MSQFKDVEVGSHVYFWFAANLTTGAAGDGATPLYDVRLAGAAAGAIPTASGTPTLLTHANYTDGLHEIDIDTTGYAAGEYAVFCTLTISTVNPAGFCGSFRVVAVGDSLRLMTPAALVDLVWDEVLTAATHNVGSSAGRRLRTLGAITLDDGTAQAGGADSIALATSALATAGIYVGCLIVIESGTGAGQSRYIVGYTAGRVAYVARHWTVAPDNTSTYALYGDNQVLFIHMGLASAGGASTITLQSTASVTDNIYVDQLIRILAGTGDDQIRQITAYNGTSKVATVSPAWTVQPDNTSYYGTLQSEGIGTGSLLTAIPWNNTAWDAEVESKVTDALVAINLDHLVGTATGIPALPVGTWLDILRSDGTEIYDRTTDSLQAIRDTEPLGTAMRGTDNAALASVCTEARLAKLTSLTFTAPLKVDATADVALDAQDIQDIVDGVIAGGLLTDEDVANAMKLAPAAGAAAAGSVQAKLDTIDTVADGIKAKTDLLGTGEVTVQSGLSSDGQRLTLTRGDAYLFASGTAIRWTFAAGVVRNLTGVVAVRFTARDKADDSVLIAATPATVTQAGAGTQILDLSLTAANTASLPVGVAVGYFDIEADFGMSDYCTLVREGALTVKRDETRHS